MTTTIATINVRMSDKERKMRAQERRRKQMAHIFYMVVCYVERLVDRVKEASVDAPARIKEGVLSWVVAFICMMLMMAVFFASLGLMTMALDFWLSTHPF